MTRVRFSILAAAGFAAIAAATEFPDETLLSAAIGLSVYLEDRRRPAYHAFPLLCFNLFAYLENRTCILDPAARQF